MPALRQARLTARSALLVALLWALGTGPSRAVTYEFVLLDGLLGGAAAIDPKGINDLGQVVGYYGWPNASKSFLYDRDSDSWSWIVHPDSKITGGNNQTYAFGINDAGLVSGNFTLPPGSGRDGAALFYDSTTDTYTTFYDPQPSPGGANTTNAYGIDGLGRTVGYGGGWGYFNPFVYDGTSFTTLDYFKGFSAWGAIPYDLNDAGTVVGTGQVAGGGVVHGVVYDGAGHDILYPGANTTALYNVNDPGIAVGYYEMPSGEQHGLLYDTGAGTYSTLDYPGALRTQIRGINDIGWIVGYAWGGSGGGGGFLGIPLASTPEPPAVLLVLSGALAAILVAGAGARRGNGARRRAG